MPRGIYAVVQEKFGVTLRWTIVRFEGLVLNPLGPSKGFRFFVGDLGNECTDAILEAAFKRLNSSVIIYNIPGIQVFRKQK